MKPKPAPQPNPQWQRTPLAHSRDGKTFRIDAMAYPELLETYRILGVQPAQPNKARR